MHKIYWYCLDKEREEFLQKSLKELEDILAKHQTGIKVGFGRLPQGSLDEVCKVLNHSRWPHFCAAEICDILPLKPPQPSPILVLCPFDSSIARCFRGDLRIWGGTCRPVAVVWEPDNKYLIWHEILHLLGAEDCCDERGWGPTCGKSNCIMQYSPVKRLIGSWPFLCDKNITRIWC